MSARILIHPLVATRAYNGVKLAEYMQDMGYDMAKMAVYQPYSARKSNVYELVREIGTRGDHTVYRRMDGTPFKHYHTPTPEAA
jgi:hypothetical protein